MPPKEDKEINDLKTEFEEIRNGQKLTTRLNVRRRSAPSRFTSEDLLFTMTYSLGKDGKDTK